MNCLGDVGANDCSGFPLGLTCRTRPSETRTPSVMIRSRAKTLKQHGGRMAIAGPRPLVREVLDIVGMPSMSPVHCDVETACAALNVPEATVSERISRVLRDQLRVGRCGRSKNASANRDASVDVSAYDVFDITATTIWRSGCGRRRVR